MTTQESSEAGHAILTRAKAEAERQIRDGKNIVDMLVNAYITGYTDGSSDVTSNIQTMLALRKAGWKPQKDGKAG